METFQNSPLTMVVMPQAEWKEIGRKIDELSSIVINRNAGELNSEWIDSATARKMLGVSKKTWQTYRDNRRIPFSQFGRKIFVRRADLESFMSSHYIKCGED